MTATKKVAVMRENYIFPTFDGIVGICRHVTAYIPIGTVLTNCYAHMEKRWSKYLRYALYNSAKYVCKWDKTFSEYLAKTRAEGKHYNNVALSHAVKKLVRLIFALEKSHSPYQATV